MAFSIATSLLVLSVATIQSAEPPTLSRVLPSAASLVRMAQAVPGIGDEDRVAITTFTNISGAPEDEWIGDGIVETLRADLTGIMHVLIVESRGRGTVEPTEGSGLVRARWVIRGGYQRLGDRVRITARVVEVVTSVVVQAARVDGAIGELFMLQDRLSAELRSGLMKESDPDFLIVPPGGETGTGSARPAVAPPSEGPLEPRRESSGEAPAAAEVATGAGFAAIPSGRIDGPPPPLPPETISRDAAGRATVRAVPISDEAIQLDGNLDEEVYQTVPPFSGFIQQVPDEGAPATEQTDAWVLFDTENIYVSARLWDSAPESQWVANEMQRDSFQIINNDTLSFSFDTFYDRRNGVAFMVNPIGGFFDYQITDEGNVNNDWNPIWDSRVGRFDGGWTVEAVVPFKSLRFQPGESQIWGLQLGRRIRWKNESTYLTPIPISGGPGMFRVSAAATVTGIEVPPGNRTFEIKPYGIGSVATDVNSVPAIENEGDGDFGFDAKYGVTQNLTADFTYNTDFAQVEVDEQQVNLTRFSLFFPEKREFFLEGRGIFDFAGGASFGGGGGPGGSGRRGGGFFGGGDKPIVFYSRRIGLEGGQTIPIRAGGRLNGKVGDFSVGVLNIQTADEPSVEALSTNFTVIRVSRDVLRRSRIGGIFTGRSVSTVADGSNQAFGVDGAFSFYDNLNINGYYAKTQTQGLQGEDESYQAALTYNGDLYAFQVDHLLVGDNFNPEVGFLRRDDFRRTFATGQYSPRPRSIEAVRQFTVGGSIDFIETTAGLLETRIAQARFQTEFENSDRLGADVQQSYEFLAEPFDIADGVTIPPGPYDFRDFFTSYSLGAQRRMFGTVTFQKGRFFSGDITAVGFRSGRIEVTPQLSVEPGVSVNHVDLPEGIFTATVASGRVTYTFTPRMFFSGLVQYNSSNESLGTNLRLRWEYQPGSELFVVYNDQRDTSFRGRPMLENRAFVVKITRLFRF